MTNLKTKTYPSRILERALQNKGYAVRVEWEVKGPPDTGVAWITGLSANGVVLIVQTFSPMTEEEHASWEVYLPSVHISPEETVNEVVEYLEA